MWQHHGTKLYRTDLQTCECGSTRKTKVYRTDLQTWGCGSTRKTIVYRTDLQTCVSGSTITRNIQVNIPDQQTNFMLNNPISCSNSISIISLIEYNLDKMSKDEKLSDKNWSKFNYLNYFPLFVGGLLVGLLTSIGGFVCSSDTN